MGRGKGFKGNRRSGWLTGSKPGTLERHLETKAYTSTFTSFDLLTLRPPKSTWRHWFCESQTEIDATKTERAAILLGFKPNGSKVSCGSNRRLAVLLRGSPHWQGLETWWLLQIFFTNVSLTTFTTWPRSGEQRAAGFSSSCCGTKNHQSENPINKQVRRTNHRSI